MTATFKILSALLSYPGVDLQRAAPEFSEVMAAEALVGGQAAAGLNRLIDEIASGDIYDLQEQYVLLFDRTRSLSLHLFEHVHGESRDRGQAMIDLKNLYEQNGLEMGSAELPDFLPLFLEFLSTQPLAEARVLLGEASHIVAAMADRLTKRESGYAAIFNALNDLAATEGIAAAQPIVADEEADPSDFDALDAAWEDTPVAFGPEADPGCKDELIAKLRAARRPAVAPGN
ncbi:MAG: nitrate reductase molybdenum cofactor assembly chaperone [Hyphomicrobiales bacterium]|nr:nitrate reductase molybdenum cofactor assembly chaperone [Hyphomicrobiales bacterium]